MLVLKDVLKPRLKPSSSGGEEFQPDMYLLIFSQNNPCHDLSVKTKFSHNQYVIHAAYSEVGF